MDRPSGAVARGHPVGNPYQFGPNHITAILYEAFPSELRPSIHDWSGYLMIPTAALLLWLFKYFWECLYRPVRLSVSGGHVETKAQTAHTTRRPTNKTANPNFAVVTLEINTAENLQTPTLLNTDPNRPAAAAVPPTSRT